MAKSSSRPNTTGLFPEGYERRVGSGVAPGKSTLQGEANCHSVGRRRPLGGARMQYHLRMTLTFPNAIVFGTPEGFAGFAQTKFDPQGPARPRRDRIGVLGGGQR